MVWQRSVWVAVSPGPVTMCTSGEAAASFKNCVSLSKSSGLLNFMDILFAKCV